MGVPALVLTVLSCWFCVAAHKDATNVPGPLLSLSQPFVCESTGLCIFSFSLVSHFPSSCHLQQIHMLPWLPPKLQTVNTHPTKWHSNQKAMRQQAVGGKTEWGRNNFHQLSWCFSVWHHCSSWLPRWILYLLPVCRRKPDSSILITFLCIISSNLQAFCNIILNTWSPLNTHRDVRISKLTKRFSKERTEIVVLWVQAGSLLLAFKASYFLLFSSSIFSHH